MVQSRSGPRFSLKTAQARLVRSEVSRQNLQSDQPVEPRILGQINFAHAAGAESLENLYGPISLPIVVEVVTD